MSEAIPVHIYFLLDRTGSMDKIRTDVIGGFNTWLTAEQAKPGKCRFTMVQFDTVDRFEVIYDAVPLNQVVPLTEATFVPRSGTPLLEAEGNLMHRALQRENERKAKGKKAEAILVVTYTDGEENSSHPEWTFERVAKLKKEREEAGWAFAYLGVGHDAYDQARRMGTPMASTVSAPRTSAGVTDSYVTYGVATTNVRNAAASGRRVKSADLFVEERDSGLLVANGEPDQPVHPMPEPVSPSPKNVD